MKRMAIASVLFTMLLATGCTGTGSTPPPAELAVLDHEMTGGEAGSVTVQVKVKNVGSVTAELAQVTVNFYDAQKSLIDSSSDGVMNLRPGEI